MATYTPHYAANANGIYRIQDIDQLTLEQLVIFIEDFESVQLPRLQVLQNYYLNQTKIKNRSGMDATRADNRLSHNFARYISTVVVGYMLGNPIKYKHENEALMEQVRDFNKRNNEHAHNSIMETNLSIYGRAFEMLYRDEFARERLAIIDPKECFVIYDTTVAFRPIAGVHMYQLQVGKKIEYHADVYTANDVRKYVGDSWKKLQQVETRPHFFLAVPIVEYWNNDDRIGDYEPILDLIDAYDVIQSDTANEIEDFASAYLVLQGQPNTEAADVDEMKKSRVIVLDIAPDGSTPAAYYLTKQYDVQGQEAMKNRLVNDIHKLAFVPDLSDEKFASNVSGEAMKYKLFVFDQLRTTKERLFREGLMQRFRILGNSWTIRAREDNVEDLEIQFTPNLPKNTKELVDIATTIEGLVSKATQLGLLPFVENVEAEMERIEEEEAEARERNLNDYPNLGSSNEGAENG